MTVVEGEAFVGPSAAMRHVMDAVDRVAAESVNVFVCGEPGTGRESVARAIHARGGSIGAPFIKVDCAKDTSQDLEARLFATSGIGRQVDKGERRTLERVRRASHLFESKNGTLFLENVVELSARLQIRLARVLRDREVVIMGEGTHVELDHRVITSGDAALDAAAQDGRLIRDLHKRLTAFRLDVPPLRNRKEDIPGLAAHLVKVLCDRANVPCKVLTESAQSLLAALPWRGNAVELRGLLEGLVVRVPRQTISLDDVLANVQLDGRAGRFVAGGSLREARARFEREYIVAVLEQHRGRIPEAARTLGIQRTNLYRKMKRLKLVSLVSGERRQEPARGKP